jgi:hypothetical protein
MENQPDLYAKPNPDIQIHPTPEQEARRIRTERELMESNSICIDGEWVSLGG